MFKFGFEVVRSDELIDSQGGFLRCYSYSTATGSAVQLNTYDHCQCSSEIR